MVIEAIIMVVVVMTRQGMREPLGACGILLYITWEYAYVKFHAAGHLRCAIYVQDTPPKVKGRQIRKRERNNTKMSLWNLLISFKCVSHNLPISSSRWLPTCSDDDLQTLHLTCKGHVCSGYSWPKHLSPLLRVLLPPADSPPATLTFYSSKIPSSFRSKSLALALCSSWNSLLLDSPKTAPSSPFRSQLKCHVLREASADYLS